MRKGMMLGQGKGYRNVIGKDPKIHSQSAHGIKQPQRIPDDIMRGKMLLKDFEKMRDTAEIRALSKVSLERPLSDLEYKRMMQLKDKLFGGKKNVAETKLPGLATFYDYLWKKNKGKFYRGTSSKGATTGVGVLGLGLYVTWEKGMAEAFAQNAGMLDKSKPLIITYKLPENLKLLDSESKVFFDFKRKVGLDPASSYSNPLQARFLTNELKRVGYDGVISDELATGIVIFDSAKAKMMP